MKPDDSGPVTGTVWVAPAGAELPPHGKIPTHWTPLHAPENFTPFRDGHAASVAHVAALHAYAETVRARVHIPWPLWCSLMGIPYRHPRPVLHNGRKPR